MATSKTIATLHRIFLFKVLPPFLTKFVKLCRVQAPLCAFGGKLLLLPLLEWYKVCDTRSAHSLQETFLSYLWKR